MNKQQARQEAAKLVLSHASADLEDTSDYPWTEYDEADQQRLSEALEELYDYLARRANGVRRGRRVNRP